ncbi:EamA family transporter [Treponema phagedenis]|uniref:EamA family transporter n=1 Tax=Treponema phagedenis TaxID=162 RepID=UPI003CC7FC26
MRFCLPLYNSFLPVCLPLLLLFCLKIILKLFGIRSRCLQYSILWCFVQQLQFRCNSTDKKNTPATTASLIYSLESLFALIISIIFTSEKPTVALFIGGTLIVLAIIISETKLSFLKQRPKNVTKESTESL